MVYQSLCTEVIGYLHHFMVKGKDVFKTCITGFKNIFNLRRILALNKLECVQALQA